MRRLGYLALVALFAGCDLYFTDGDDDCLAPADIGPNVRNPDTGQCETFGGGFPCDGVCGPCSLEGDIALSQPIPDWGSCSSQCQGLDEFACVEASGCYAIYDANSNVDEPPRYMDCWQIAPSGPAPGGCTGLDAYECSRHDNCSAYYDVGDVADSSRLIFSSCRAEQIRGCYSDDECGAGAHCSTSEGECSSPPGCTANECPDVCYGKCVSDADICAVALCEAGTHCEAQCTAENGCHPVCVPDSDLCAAADCAPGTECVQTCDGIDPNNPGCGVCTIACVPVGACESLDEPTCGTRADCRAVYSGEDCTCYSNGSCECQTLTYERCETK